MLFKKVKYKNVLAIVGIALGLAFTALNSEQNMVSAMHPNDGDITIQEHRLINGNNIEIDKSNMWAKIEPSTCGNGFSVSFRFKLPKAANSNRLQAVLVDRNPNHKHKHLENKEHLEGIEGKISDLEKTSDGEFECEFDDVIKSVYDVYIYSGKFPNNSKFVAKADVVVTNEPFDMSLGSTKSAELWEDEIVNDSKCGERLASSNAYWNNDSEFIKIAYPEESAEKVCKAGDVVKVAFFPSDSGSRGSKDVDIYKSLYSPAYYGQQNGKKYAYIYGVPYGKKQRENYEAHFYKNAVLPGNFINKIKEMDVEKPQ